MRVSRTKVRARRQGARRAQVYVGRGCLYYSESSANVPAVTCEALLVIHLSLLKCAIWHRAGDFAIVARRCLLAIATVSVRALA